MTDTSDIERSVASWETDTLSYRAMTGRFVELEMVEFDPRDE